MTSKERIHAAIMHQTPDRVPPTMQCVDTAWEKLIKYFGVKTADELQDILDIDTRIMDLPPYIGPENPPFINADGEMEYTHPLGYRYINKWNGVEYNWHMVYFPYEEIETWEQFEAFDKWTKLCAFYGVEDTRGLKRVCGDDFYAVEIPYHSPTCNAIFAAFDWYMNGSNVDTEHRTLTADGCFADCEDMDDVLAVNFPWPDPEKYIDPELCRKLVDEAPEGKVVMGMFWACHFQDTCAAFGMQTALMNMVAEPEIVHYVDEKIIEFYKKALRIFLEATKGKVAFCGGVDTQDLPPYGTPEQVAAKVRELRTVFPTGLIVSPSHEALQADVPAEHVEALFDEAGKIY